MYWKKLFSPILSFETAGGLLAPGLQQSCCDCLIKVYTKHGRRSPLPYSPFCTIHGAGFALSSVVEFGGMVIACQLL